MHIDSLNYFYQVAKTQSISTVAKDAHISQSALSQQISKLENKLNVQLFNRTNKGMSLTVEGQILFKYAESILSSYNKMIKELNNSINNRRLLSIEAVESIGLTILPMAISRIKKHFPSYTINLDIVDSCSKTNIFNNICDIFICNTEPQNLQGITTKFIGNEKLILIADKKFPSNSLTKEDLLNIPLILASDKNHLNSIISSEVNPGNIILDNANILYTTNSYFSALKGVSTSKAATLIPSSIYNHYHSLPNIKVIEIQDFSLDLPIYISYLDSFYKTNSDFIKSLKYVLKSYLD